MARRRTKRPNYGPDESPNMDRNPPANSQSTNSAERSARTNNSGALERTNADHAMESNGGTHTTARSTNNQISYPDPTGTASTAPIQGTIAPRRSRRTRINPRPSTCPYNLRSKRRRLSQNGHSDAISPTLEVGQASSTSVQEENQDSPPINDQNSVVRHRQVNIEHPRNAAFSELGQENEGSSAMAMARDEIPSGGPVQVTGPESVGSEDTAEVIAEQVEVREIVAILNEEAVPDLSDDEVILVRHTLRGEPYVGKVLPSSAIEPDTIRPAAEVTPSTERKIVLEAYRPAFCWRYDTDSQHCVICMEDLEKFCPSCQELENQSTPSDPDCKITWGKCSHVFHNHCLQTWFKESNNHNQTCPLDRQVFQVDHTA